MSWHKYYQTRVGESYPKFCANKYKPFIELLNKYQSGYVAEEGCGIGTITKIIYRDNVKYTMIDNSSEQLVLAKKNLQNRTAVFSQRNILDIKNKMKYNLIYSHGVLEHFNEADISQIIERQRQSSKVAIHYVPTDEYKQPSYGDEMLKPCGWWVKRFKPKEWILFNSGRDLALVF